MFPFLGGLASGALGLIGSSMNTSAQNAVNQQMLQLQAQQQHTTAAQWDLANTEAMQQQQYSNKQTSQQTEFQEWLAQNGVQSRVADARAAGISPLAALGMQPVGGASVAVGGGTPPGPVSGSVPSLTAGTPGAGVASLGQDISRALQATQSPEERAVSVEKTRQDLEKGDLENQLLKSQILDSAHSRMSGAHVGPGLKDPKELVPMPTSTGSGNVAVYPSRDVEGASWIDPLAKTQWLFKHELLPGVGFNDIQTSVLDKQSRTGPASASESWYKNLLTGDYYKGPNYGYYAGKFGKALSKPVYPSSLRYLPGMF